LASVTKIVVSGSGGFMGVNEKFSTVLHWKDNDACVVLAKEVSRPDFFGVPT